MFTPIFGEMIQFDSYFSIELKPPVSYVEGNQKNALI